MRQGGRFGGIFGPGERTVISIVTEITINWLAGWGVSLAWFIGWASVYVIGPLVYVGLETRNGTVWGVWDNVWGWYNLNWTLLVAWWLVGVPLSTSALVYRFLMEIVFKDYLPHPDKAEAVEVVYQDVPTQKPTENHRHEIPNGKGYDVVEEAWENHPAIVRFAGAVAQHKKNFSESEAKRHKVSVTDYEKLHAQFLMHTYFVPDTVGHRKTLKLTERGRRAIRAIADTSPTP